MGTFHASNGDPLVTSSTGEAVLYLHQGATLSLKFVEGRGSGPSDGRTLASNDPAVKVSAVTSGSPALNFRITASGPANAIVTGFNAAGVPSGSLVVVSGDFKNHKDMDRDLLADICRGNDAAKITEVQRILFGDESNIFDQNNPANISEHGELACGKVVKSSAEKLFGAINPISYENPYHEPLRAVRKRDDVKYRASTMSKVRTAIAAMLEKGTPVRVGVLDNPVNMHVAGGKLYAYFAGGHTVLIVGCNKAADKFLYIDPWADGSTLKYTGGFAHSPLAFKSRYLGTLEAVYDASRSVESGMTPNLIRQTSESEGTFSQASGTFLELVSGPLVPVMTSRKGVPAKAA